MQHFFGGDQKSSTIKLCNGRGCQIGMQGSQLCAKPRHFCKLDVATSRMAFLDLNLKLLTPPNAKTATAVLA
jgi:hypothetical protein